MKKSDYMSSSDITSICSVVFIILLIVFIIAMIAPGILGLWIFFGPVIIIGIILYYVFYQ